MAKRAGGFKAWRTERISRGWSGTPWKAFARSTKSTGCGHSRAMSWASPD
jgi:hypothetical protein